MTSEQKVEALLRYHRPITHNTTVHQKCAECGHVWPCRTAMILAAGRGPGIPRLGR